jgi:hypothetical protein
MKRLSCSVCSARVYFENTVCMTCGHALAFDPRDMTMVGLDTSGEPVERRDELGGPARVCENSRHSACNWLVDDPARDFFCPACRLNRTIPNLAEPGALAAWQRLEDAKKRLVYGILRFGLPLHVAGGPPLTFDFMKFVLTGHKDGVITIDLSEADPVERERRRNMFAEPYRTLLGHLRHESGHYYWDLLIRRGGRGEAFRALFGDERKDYEAALRRHHATGAPPDWQIAHVSAYASAHPWEDWAETWAHYLHIADAVETAEVEGMEPRASGLVFGSVWPFHSEDAYRTEGFQALMDRWAPLALALNGLSRSMGHTDFYPFVISPVAREKLEFVHRAIRDFRQRHAANAAA